MKWRHTNGNIYEIIYIANEHSMISEKELKNYLDLKDKKEEFSKRLWK